MNAVKGVTWRGCVVSLCFDGVILTRMPSNARARALSLSVYLSSFSSGWLLPVDRFITSLCLFLSLHISPLRISVSQDATRSDALSDVLSGAPLVLYRTLTFLGSGSAADAVISLTAFWIIGSNCAPSVFYREKRERRDVTY